MTDRRIATPIRQRALAAALVVSWLGGTASGEIVGDGAKLHPVLASVADSLHVKGIDVVGGDAADVPLGEIGRPRVALLTGMPKLAPRTTWGKRLWVRDFLSGATGFVAAIAPPQTPGPAGPGTPASQAASKREFLERWNETPPDRRVFLSFTSQDAEYAGEVARALQERGFTTFTFLKAHHEATTFDASFVGRMFSEADHHFVVDTAHARESRGVWLEGRWLRKQGRRTGDGPMAGGPTDDAAGPGPTKPSDGPRRSGGQGSPGGGEGDGGPELEAFRRGITGGGWIVTENSETPGKLFVHRSLSGGTLRDLEYLVKREGDGSWTVHKPTPASFGTGYGRKIGSMPRPSSVEIGPCSCR